MRHIEAPIVLLKGAAYAMAELPPARGRLVSDVDILVPRDVLPAVEAALLAAGWETMKLDPYDQYYYREWMHELPPLRHRLRDTVVDVHHAILPLTGRLRPDSERLLQAAIPLRNSQLRVLAPHDMILHSAAHLFHDGAFESGLRDLVDLHDLLSHFGDDHAFWAGLVPRAAELQLQRPLYYALRFAGDLLATNVPDDVLSAAARAGGPSVVNGKIMHGLMARALRPKHPDVSSVADGAAGWLLYVRSHYLRMPLHMLIPHLARKAMRQRGNAASAL